MEDEAKALWAELRRGSTLLLVSESAWISLWLKLAFAAHDEPAWDEAGGTWLVSQRDARALALAVEETSISLFARTYAHFEGPLVSGTTSVAALTAEGAEEMRRELITFLQDGAFLWRIVSL